MKKAERASGALGETAREASGMLLLLADQTVSITRMPTVSTSVISSRLSSFRSTVMTAPFGSGSGVSTASMESRSL